jgi:hypothetical protein
VESSEGQYSQAVMERTMKVQEVILRAMAGKLKWWEAAEGHEWAKKRSGHREEPEM